MTINMCTLIFFFNDTATTEIYTLSLHDALPIFFYSTSRFGVREGFLPPLIHVYRCPKKRDPQSLRQYDRFYRSEEHTSELQSRQYLVCRLLLEKKKKCDIATQP